MGQQFSGGPNSPAAAQQVAQAVDVGQHAPAGQGLEVGAQQASLGQAAAGFSWLVGTGFKAVVYGR